MHGVNKFPLKQIWCRQNLGTPWPAGQLPLQKYEYKIESEELGSGHFAPMSSIDDPDEAIVDILKWLYHANVLYTPGHDIIYREELRFIVQHDQICWDSKGNWHGLVRFWDVRDQLVKTVTFRVAA